VPDPVWVGSVTVRVGEFHVGIRTDDDAVLRDLHALYRDILVEDDRSDDYSISVTPAGDGPARALPCLSHGRRALLRSRSVARLTRLLDVTLAGLVPPSGNPTQTITGFSLLTQGPGALLVPSSAIAQSAVVERHAAAAGMRVADEAAVRVDLGTLEAIVVPGLSGGTSHPALQDDVVAPVGRYAIRSIIWREDEIDPDERAALAAVRLIPRVNGRGALARQEFLERIVDLARRTHPVPLRGNGSNLPAVLEPIE
jgi:hypothetical protein